MANKTKRIEILTKDELRKTLSRLASQVVEKVKSEAESVASEINSLEQQIAQFV